jgi:hypothetical protein
MSEFARTWNTTGKTWIKANVQGPWAVDNSMEDCWGIINTETGKTKMIGRVKLRGVNFFDRAMDEANRRNQEILAASAAA